MTGPLKGVSVLELSGIGPAPFAGMYLSDLGAEVLRGLMGRVAIDPADVDDVIWGCVGQIGAQAFNVGRNCWLAAGFDDGVPAVTLDRQCGSSQQAVHFASQAIRSGIWT